MCVFLEHFVIMSGSFGVKAAQTPPVLVYSPLLNFFQPFILLFLAECILKIHPLQWTVLCSEITS